MLPDYCEQYAVKLENHLASQKTELKFGDGWQLQSVNADLNSTEVAVEFLKTAATIAGAAIKGPTPPAGGGGGGDEAQSGGGRTAKPTRRVFKRVEKRIVEPGVYPLFNRETCQSLPGFVPAQLKFTTSVSFTEVTPSAAKGGTAGGMEPGVRQ